jgi:hypothetical protein
MVGESRTPNGIERMPDHLGVGEGQRYRGSRVMLVEGRALTSGVMEKEERQDDWRKPETSGNCRGIPNPSVPAGEEW